MKNSTVEQFLLPQLVKSLGSERAYKDAPIAELLIGLGFSIDEVLTLLSSVKLEDIRSMYF